MSMNLTLDGFQLYQTPTEVTWLCLYGAREHPSKRTPVNHIQTRLRYIAWALGVHGLRDEEVNEHVQKLMQVKNPRFSYI